MAAQNRHRKVLSFCLYGDNPLYCEGAIENLRRAAVIYPGWECVVFVGESVPTAVVEALYSLDAQVFLVAESFASEREMYIRGAFWRLLALNLPDISHLVFRDCDSRLGWKERAAVDAWLASGRHFHFMYDHPYHEFPIMAGMWGCLGGIIEDIEGKLAAFHASRSTEANYWQRCDQAFLREVIWKEYVAASDYIAHGEEHICAFHIKEGISIEPFPAFQVPEGCGLAEPEFVGQVIHTPGDRDKTPKI